MQQPQPLLTMEETPVELPSYGNDAAVQIKTEPSFPEPEDRALFEWGPPLFGDNFKEEIVHSFKEENPMKFKDDFSKNVKKEEPDVSRTTERPNNWDFAPRQQFVMH